MLQSSIDTILPERIPLNKYFVIIGATPRIINTTRNDKSHTPVTLFHYPLIAVVDSFFNELIPHDQLPSGYVLQRSLENVRFNDSFKEAFTDIDEKVSEYLSLVRVLQVVDKDTRSFSFCHITDHIFKKLIAMNEFRSFIASVSDVSEDNVFRIIGARYVLSFSSKQDYVYVPIEDGVVYMAHIMGVTRDCKKAYRVFPKAMDTTKFSMRFIKDNVVYKHMAVKDTLIHFINSLIKDPVLNDSKIIDAEFDVMLFGRKFTITDA